MLFRALTMQYGPQEERRKETWPAARAFLETQRHASPPFAVIFQSAHAQLAGDLAASLYADLFGELPEDVIRAIYQHDAGWITNDERQMQRLFAQDPQPFPDLPARESLFAWRDSIRHAESISPVAMVLVSRHFSLLATGDPLHREFKAQEEQRRAFMEQRLGVSSEKLNRWVGALGFCDLLSLYLCSGSKVPVAFPVCHPADSVADSAAEIRLSWKNGRLSCSPSVVKPNTQLSLNAVLYRGRTRETEPLHLQWEF
jgi:Protein of unknown function (DUF3891)